MNRAWLRATKRVSICLTTACVFNFAGCMRLFQTNMEVLFAPQVIENAFLLPTTLVFRLFGRWLY
jgi:hypothetical protein